MTYYKYTPAILAEAAAQSHSIAGVLRVLGIRWNGGSHAHISRQLKRFGIDTSHFTGGAHNLGGTSKMRRVAEEILVQLPAGARRTRGHLLRRALLDIGVPESCEKCGNGDTWLGEQLTLHVDHINGDFLDNRRYNLRLLCPNCHSQTSTFAGRNRGVYGSIATFGAAEQTMPAGGTDNIEKLTDVLESVNRGQLTAGEAAKIVGCATDHVNTMRRRLFDGGPTASSASIATVIAYRDAVIAYALANPGRGITAISRALREPDAGAIELGYGAINNILRAAGLNSPAARRAAASAIARAEPTV